MVEKEETPWTGRAKDRFVQKLFASIAPRYDLLNTIISFNRHKAWRRFSVSLAGLSPGMDTLDVAAGTGDFSLELRRSVGAEGSVVAMDFCAPMVDIGRRKTSTPGLGNIRWVEGDAMSLPFPSDTFDCAVTGFALRNVSSVPRTISEMTRVVKPGGMVISLEINRPMSVLLRPLWRVYFYHVLPVMARRFGGKKEAYEYLPASVTRFYSRQELSNIMIDAGLHEVRMHDLTLGVVCVHTGVKP